MPIYEGSNAIESLTIGSSVNIASAYVGSDKVFTYDPTQILTLTSTTNLNLATWLSGQGAVTTKPIIINMASDQTIGGTVADGYAVTIGDISSYLSITWNVNGQIQGKNSSHAIYSTSAIDITNNGTISGAIEDVAGSDPVNLTIVVGSTGKILGGGGNGGDGGKGGDGECYNYAEEKRSYSYKYNQYGFGGGCACDPNYGVYWDGSYKGIGGGQGLRNGNYWYSTDGGTSQAPPSLYAPGRGYITAYSGGAGGAGGDGAGYQQTRTDGAAGAPGGCRSGSGGTGGNGGDWGVAGATGAQGGTGYYVSGTNSSVPRAGAAGSAGEAAGKAVVSTSQVNVS